MEYRVTSDWNTGTYWFTYIVKHAISTSRQMWHHEFLHHVYDWQYPNYLTPHELSCTLHPIKMRDIQLHPDAGHSVLSSPTSSHIKMQDSRPHLVSSPDQSGLALQVCRLVTLLVRQESKVRPRAVPPPTVLHSPPKCPSTCPKCLCHSCWRVWCIAICCMWQNEIAGLRQYEAIHPRLAT